MQESRKISRIDTHRGSSSERVRREKVMLMSANYIYRCVPNIIHAFSTGGKLSSLTFKEIFNLPGKSSVQTILLPAAQKLIMVNAHPAM